MSYYCADTRDHGVYYLMTQVGPWYSQAGDILK
jgi:hypothetical protein